MQYPRLKITVLGSGTSGGVPMIACPCDVCSSTQIKDKRLRSSIMIQSKNLTIVIDTGPDFRQQMLRENVKSLDGILFTHSHKDHIAGLDDVRAFNFFSKKPMQLYANDATNDALKRDFFYAFEEHIHDSLPNLCINEIDLNEFYIDHLLIKPILLWHYKMPVYGYRFGKFTYITDANKIDASELEKIRGSEILIINALRQQKHISHFNLSEAIELVKELNIPQVYFTHISHQMGLHHEVEKLLPPTIKLAYDGLCFEVN